MEKMVYKIIYIACHVLSELQTCRAQSMVMKYLNWRGGVGWGRVSCIVPFLQKEGLQKTNQNIHNGPENNCHLILLRLSKFVHNSQIFKNIYIDNEQYKIYLKGNPSGQMRFACPLVCPIKRLHRGDTLDETGSPCHSKCGTNKSPACSKDKAPSTGSNNAVRASSNECNIVYLASTKCKMN